MQRRFARKGLVVWFVGVGEDPEALRVFAAELQLGIPVLLDAEGTAVGGFVPANVRRSLAPGQLPVAVNVLIEASGRVRSIAVRDQPGFEPNLQGESRLLETMPDLMPAAGAPP